MTVIYTNFANAMGKRREKNKPQPTLNKQLELPDTRVKEKNESLIELGDIVLQHSPADIRQCRTELYYGFQLRKSADFDRRTGGDAVFRLSRLGIH